MIKQENIMRDFELFACIVHWYDLRLINIRLWSQFSRNRYDHDRISCSSLACHIVIQIQVYEKKNAEVKNTCHILTARAGDNVRRAQDPSIVDPRSDDACCYIYSSEVQVQAELFGFDAKVHFHDVLHIW